MFWIFTFPPFHKTSDVSLRLCICVYVFILLKILTVLKLFFSYPNYTFDIRIFYMLLLNLFIFFRV